VLVLYGGGTTGAGAEPLPCARIPSEVRVFHFISRSKMRAPDVRDARVRYGAGFGILIAAFVEMTGLAMQSLSDSASLTEV
jgi:hypothetical protein